jgi:hypothetical protein
VSEVSDPRLPTVAPPPLQDDSDGAVNSEVDGPDDQSAGDVDQSDPPDQQHEPQDSDQPAPDLDSSRDCSTIPPRRLVRP